APSDAGNNCSPINNKCDHCCFTSLLLMHILPRVEKFVTNSFKINQYIGKKFSKSGKTFGANVKIRYNIED
ncbi:hypothetical protein, partial [Enterococcus faecalis]